MPHQRFQRFDCNRGKTRRKGRELFITQSRLLTSNGKKSFESIVGKGENVGNQHFLLFLQCFLPFQRQIPLVKTHQTLSSALALNLDIPKNCVVW